MFKKFISILLIIFILNSCILTKIDKESEPLIDFGTPIIGHFRNKDTAKGILYTILFCTSLIGIILFSPTQYSANDNQVTSIIPVSRDASDPLFYTFIGFTVVSFGSSSIDTAATYHLANKKIIELNNIIWDPKSNITKYQAIKDFREKEARQEKTISINKDEIDYYRKKLITGTISEDELIFIRSIPELNAELEKELGYYLINKELKEQKNEKEK